MLVFRDCEPATETDGMCSTMLLIGYLDIVMKKYCSRLQWVEMGSEEPVVDYVGEKFHLCDLMCKRRRVCTDTAGCH